MTTIVGFDPGNSEATLTVAPGGSRGASLTIPSFLGSGSLDELRRVRGGVEPMNGQPPATLLTAPFHASSFVRREAKLRIARRAARHCSPGESIIVNGGTTTYCMADFVAPMGLNVLTNSFPLASHLLSTGTCRITVPGGEVYREQNIIVSAYEHDTAIDRGARVCVRSDANDARGGKARRHLWPAV